MARHLLFHTCIYYMSKKSAFTIVELMLVIAILADLAVIAMPAFIRSRNMAQDTKFINDIRIGAAAFEMYVAENNSYPANAAPAVIPTGMNLYLKGMDWTGGNSIGGSWQWMLNQYSTTAQVGVVFGTPPDVVRMSDIDRRMDDGVLTTGAFRQQTSTVYTYTLEQ